MDYLLFTHFTLGKRGDLARFVPGASADTSIGKSVLSDFLPDIVEILTGKTGRRGTLVLFYDAGWGAYLEELERAFSTETQDREKDFGSSMCRSFNALLADNAWRRCVRVVGAKEVFEFFANASGQAARDMFKWFMGRSKDLLYDAPKVVDAILRIRAMEHPLPVFRIDQDVLFPVSVDERAHTVRNLAPGPRRQEWSRQLSRALDESLALFRKINDNAHIGRNIFSCQYVYPSFEDSITGALESWGRGFATRIDPVRSIARPEQLVAPERFYGIAWNERAHTWRLGTSRMGLTAIGAHPLDSVISGALMYLSAGLLVDLPPVSVAGRPVLWIDDHLRWALHKALGHLEGMPRDLWGHIGNGIRPSVAKWRDVSIATDWNYMLTLLRGCIFDRWISASDFPKLSQEAASGFGIDLARVPRGYYDSTTRFITVLKHAIERSVEPDDPADKKELWRELENEAIERILTASRIWQQLPGTAVSQWLFEPGGGNEDFLFQRGSVASNERNNLAALEIKDIKESLNPRVLRDVEGLITDAIEYISWAVAWPKVMHMIRVAPPGSFAADVDWAGSAGFPRTVAEFGFDPPSEGFRALSEDLAGEMEIGAKRWGGEIAMLPAWLGPPAIKPARANVSESYGALRIGRSTVDWKLLSEESLKGFVDIEGIAEYPILDQDALLDAISKAVAALGAANGGRVPGRLGLVFPFPSTALPDGDAVPHYWTKEFGLAQPAEDRSLSVRAWLRKRISALKSSDIGLYIVNDAVSLLIGDDAPVVDGEGAAAVILGAGFNIAAFLPRELLPKVQFPARTRLMAVNFEVAAYSPDLLTTLDDVLDAQSLNPMKHRLEKALGDIYLDSILSAARAALGEAPPGLEGSIAGRSLQLLAATLVATRTFLRVARLRVIMGGGRIWGKRWPVDTTGLTKILPREIEVRGEPDRRRLLDGAIAAAMMFSGEI